METDRLKTELRFTKKKLTSGDNNPPDELLRFKLNDESDSVSASIDGELIKLQESNGFCNKSLKASNEYVQLELAIRKKISTRHHVTIDKIPKFYSFALMMDMQT